MKSKTYKLGEVWKSAMYSSSKSWNNGNSYSCKITLKTAWHSLSDSFCAFFMIQELFTKHRCNLKYFLMSPSRIHSHLRGYVLISIESWIKAIIVSPFLCLYICSWSFYKSNDRTIWLEIMVPSHLVGRVVFLIKVLGLCTSSQISCSVVSENIQRILTNQ